MSGLAIGSLSLTPEFNSATLDYTATTANATNTITAKPTDETATVAITVGGVAVENKTAATWIDGENVVAVTITNGEAAKTYTVTVTKE